MKLAEKAALDNLKRVPAEGVPVGAVAPLDEGGIDRATAGGAFQGCLDRLGSASIRKDAKTG